MLSHKTITPQTPYTRNPLPFRLHYACRITYGSTQEALLRDGFVDSRLLLTILDSYVLIQYLLYIVTVLLK